MSMQWEDDELDFDGIEPNSDMDLDLDDEQGYGGYGTDETIEDDIDSLYGDDAEEVSAPLDVGQDKNGAVKVAIIAVVIGVILVVACFGVSTMLKKNKNKTTEVVQNTSTTVSVQNNTDVAKSISTKKSTASKVKQEAVEENKDKVISIGNNDTQNNVSDTWIEYEDSGDLEFSRVTSEFTVISINYYAKILNDNNDKIIRCTAKGNISGLDGTFEVDIPYNKAHLIKRGTRLKISYAYQNRKNSLIVNEINFE